MSVHEACKPVGAALSRISESHFGILHHAFLCSSMQDIQAVQRLHAYQRARADDTELDTSIAMRTCLRERSAILAQHKCV